VLTDLHTAGTVYFMSTGCDTERCESCGSDTVAGNDEAGLCTVCSGDTSLEHLLRLMASGITRDPRTGRFTKIGK
jgi:hypothetical protein